MEKFSYLRSSNADYIEEQYQRYLQDPDSVEDSWRYFFEGLELGGDVASNGHGEEHTPPAVSTDAPRPVSLVAKSDNVVVEFPLSKEAKVLDLIMAYRHRGHVLAHLDPLSDAPPKSHPLLNLESFGLNESDLDSRFRAARLLGFPDSPLREILAFLKETYCSTIGVEYMHTQEAGVIDFLQKAMESNRNKPRLNSEEKKRILEKLTEADNFEVFLHTRYIAQKRFSVEGGDAIIPALDTVIEEIGALGSTDFVLGMAHRGRLNVLTNIFGKKYEMVFSEFEGNYATGAGEGDVKYHMGYSADATTRTGNKVHLSLLANPSHLEAVNPVVEGVARAKQTLKNDKDRSLVVPVLIHGDAAFAGQGLIYETLQLSRLRGYDTGGTIHFVINNQVGFTTDPVDARSTPYSTDVAKMLESPVFHVNGDDVEAVVHATKLAVQYRQKFKRDVIIDIVCYRKYGHNEGDEPAFTQPLMYKKIKSHPSPKAIYAAKLKAEGAATEAEIQAIADRINERLTKSHSVAKEGMLNPAPSVFEGDWKGLEKSSDATIFTPAKTQVDEALMKEVGVGLTSVPATFKPNSKLVRLLESRRKMIEDGEGIDWGMGEALAYGTLLVEGTPVRMTGQDCERGTFTHRHAVLSDSETGEKYTPHNHLKNGQAFFEIYNSNLSEQAVLGFEFGFSLANPKTLTLWEAQFGDFANGAQIIIDQFIAAAESKWSRSSGVVLLLPHGYEGQGPEHSSARLERFLTMCGKNNMQVCNLTTPAQIFHVLRRQVRRNFRTPLIIMSPKSLLRHPEVVSGLKEFTQGGFQEVITDGSTFNTAAVRRVLLCSGKIYYELKTEREKQKREDIAILRLEQLYPFPKAKIEEELAKYSSATEVVWVQEEPRNMGAWRSIQESLNDCMSTQILKYVGRDIAAAPAVGSPKVHAKEQAALIAQSFSEKL